MSNSATNQSQAVSKFPAKTEMSKKPMRHLDHMIDLQEGVRFTMVPRCISDAWLNGTMPDAKFKLLFCLLSQSREFAIRRRWLLQRFSAKTLVKYLHELVDEGFIRVEYVPCPSGGKEKIYHTNRISEWNVPRETSGSRGGGYKGNRKSDDSSPGNLRKSDDSFLGNGSLGNPLTETIWTETKDLKNTHTYEEGNKDRWRTSNDASKEQIPENPPLEEEKPESPAERVGRMLAEKLKEHGVDSDYRLIALNSSLAERNRGRGYPWQEKILDEAVAWILGRRSQAGLAGYKCPGTEFLTFCTFYREPRDPETQKSYPERQPSKRSTVSSAVSRKDDTDKNDVRVISESLWRDFVAARHREAEKWKVPENELDEFIPHEKDYTIVPDSKYTGPLDLRDWRFRKDGYLTTEV